MSKGRGGSRSAATAPRQGKLRGPRRSRRRPRRPPSVGQQSQNLRGHATNR
ncbi:hypothetical protein ACFFX0_29345 [Citricoccus parietis]|uniref:Uncharacterized protein n=1 Tax=Citricoccus parietis TaxID=592307 RepID=A0ABV5G8X1_9MICC